MIYLENDGEGGVVVSPSPDSLPSVSPVSSLEYVSSASPISVSDDVSSVSPVASSDAAVSSSDYSAIVSVIQASQSSLENKIDSVISLLNVLLLFAVFVWCFRRLELWRENAAVKRSSKDDR